MPPKGAPAGLDYVTFRLHPGEWETLCAALKEEGYPLTGEGVHDFLFDGMEDLEELDDDPKENPKPLDPALHKLFEYAVEHPEFLKKATALGKSAFMGILKNKMGL